MVRAVAVHAAGALASAIGLVLTIEAIQWALIWRQVRRDRREAGQ